MGLLLHVLADSKMARVSSERTHGACSYFRTNVSFLRGVPRLKATGFPKQLTGWQRVRGIQSSGDQWGSGVKLGICNQEYSYQAQVRVLLSSEPSSVVMLCRALDGQLQGLVKFAPLPQAGTAAYHTQQGPLDPGSGRT